MFNNENQLALLDSFASEEVQDTKNKYLETLTKYNNIEVINIDYLVSFNFYNLDEIKEETYPYINFNLSNNKTVKWQFNDIDDAKKIYLEIDRISLIILLGLLLMRIEHYSLIIQLSMEMGMILLPVIGI